nr:hypothetical protein Q903MT_gene742 [Picea sitchensis]
MSILPFVSIKDPSSRYSIPSVPRILVVTFKLVPLSVGKVYLRPHPPIEYQYVLTAPSPL